MTSDSNIIDYLTYSFVKFVHAIKRTPIILYGLEMPNYHPLHSPFLCFT